ncbi:hypothetical protein MTO96_038565 [Rhipicephalus appendiculatus]
MRRVVKASRIPNLPRDHIKTIVRPRGGLDVRKADLIAFKRALAKAASLTAEQTCEDTLQVDICYACGDLGHRADVLPKGEEQRRRRGCGTLTPPEDHHCDPKCAICGGSHLTADRQCKKRFQVPFIVR